MSEGRVDLRSDTLTRPTPAMRRAMAEAEVGDDVFGEDPTVNRLEATAAAMLGKEAALFVSSGTQGNLVSLLAHCGRGEEVILGDQCHSFTYEAGGSAAVGGVHPRPLRTSADGRLDPDEIEAAVQPDNPHFPKSRLICLENSHNRCGGAVLPLDYMQAVREVADRNGLSIHLDGARMFNAAVALEASPADVAEAADSLSFCLSKGLAAPVGSLVCGSADFIYRARRARKLLGGGMRQAGVLAAAGLVALEQMPERLVDDHANARRLAEGIAELPGIALDPKGVQTNIVIFALERADMTPAELVDALAAEGVDLFAIGGNRLRAVTHYEVERDGIDRTLNAFRNVLTS